MNKKIVFLIVLIVVALLAAFAFVSNAEAGKEELCPPVVGIPFYQAYNPDLDLIKDYGKTGYVYLIDPNRDSLVGNIKDVAGFYQGDPDEWGLTLFYKIQTSCK